MKDMREPDNSLTVIYRIQRALLPKIYFNTTDDRFILFLRILYQTVANTMLRSVFLECTNGIGCVLFMIR
jgi:hypothetical protein